MAIHFDRTIIAHRGASAYAPENTMMAFYQAYLMGAKWIEFDVMLAACGEPVIFHDETLERTTCLVGEVGIHPYAYLKTLEVGAWFSPFAVGERMPHLKTVLMFLKETGMSANIEIKPLPGQDIETVDAVIQTVARVFGEAPSNLLYSSFSMEALLHLRKNHPEAQVGVLLDAWQPQWESWIKKIQPISIHVEKEMATPGKISQIKQLNKFLLCYTVNQKEEALALFEQGVDGVFSDYPDLLSG